SEQPTRARSLRAGGRPFAPTRIVLLTQRVGSGVVDGTFAGASEDHRPKAGSRAKRATGRRQAPESARR
ncbi:MAG: hypothetical protein ACE5EO_11450, partial [Candidatus Krumholzibacteriia bacterium]